MVRLLGCIYVNINNIIVIKNTKTLPISSSSSAAGSNFGEINAMKRLRRYIAKAYVTIYQPCNMNTRTAYTSRMITAKSHLGIRYGTIESSKF